MTISFDFISGSFDYLLCFKQILKLFCMFFLYSCMNIAFSILIPYASTCSSTLSLVFSLQGSLALGWKASPFKESDSLEFSYSKPSGGLPSYLITRDFFFLCDLCLADKTLFFFRGVALLSKRFNSSSFDAYSTTKLLLLLEDWLILDSNSFSSSEFLFFAFFFRIEFFFFIGIPFFFLFNKGFVSDCSMCMFGTGILLSRELEARESLCSISWIESSSWFGEMNPTFLF